MLFDELSWRGLVHQVTDPALPEVLAREQVVGYGGFDPTSDSLTVGNLVLIVTLMRFQRAGHRPIALAGGGTGMVGDPSGKAEERALLTPDVLAANLAAIRAQLERFLDFGPNGALLVDNGAWLGSLGLLEFLRDVGKHFTVNAMIAKESVRARLSEREQGISYTEFSYMLLQAYDFLHLHDAHGCRLQLGGSDQWGNITAGIELIRRVRSATAYGLTFPLVTKADGTKFGKSEAGNVWLDARRTSPYAMYQFFLRSEDAVVGSYLRYYTFRSREEIEAFDGETAAHPERRAAQRALAHDLVTLVHGEGEARQAERASAVLFSEEIRDLPERTLLEVLEDAPSCDAPIGQPVVDVAVAAGVAKSRGEARRVIEQGGLYLNNRRVQDPEASLSPADLIHGRYAVLRRGKATQCLLRVSSAPPGGRK
jgi:tyrosyl-tRNA synthetase